MNQTSDTVFYQAVFPSNSVIIHTNDSVKENASETQSLFSEQTYDSKSFVKINKTSHNGIEPFWILAGSLVMVAFLNLIFHKYYKYKILGFFFSKYKSLNLEKEERNKLLSRVLSLIYFFNLALFLYVIIPLLNLNLPFIHGVNTYWVIFLFITIFSIAKSIIIMGLSLLFTNFEQGWTLLSVNNESQWVLTLILLPLNFFLIYAFNILWLIALIGLLLTIIFVIKQVKLYILVRRSCSYYNYQIILYLCSLEILPLLVIFRYLI